MLPSGKCIKCASSGIVLKARVMDRTQGGEYDLNLRVDAHPDAFLFKETERSRLEARVCSQCGYTEFYATDPVALLAAWRRSLEDTQGQGSGQDPG